MFNSLLFKNLLIAALICLSVTFKLNNLSSENNKEIIKRDTNDTSNNRYIGYKGVLPVNSNKPNNINNNNDTVTLSPNNYDNSTLNYGNDTVDIIIYEEYDSFLSPFVGILPVGLN
uniref:Exported protein n=1 Tax=Strongyloides stercoralis TaxID=6248 RepID=A0A0K0EG60_STRER